MTLNRRSLFYSILSLPLLAMLRAPAHGQAKSPHQTASLDVNGKKVEISYGRPSLRGRELSQLVPKGEVWRLGADAATKLTVSAPCTLGTLKIPAGSYALFAMSSGSSWTMIVNTVADQFGAFDYDKSKDLGRFDVPVKKAESPVEQFTISLKESGGGATVSFEWGTASAVTQLKFD